MAGVLICSRFAVTVAQYFPFVLAGGSLEHAAMEKRLAKASRTTCRTSPVSQAPRGNLCHRVVAGRAADTVRSPSRVRCRSPSSNVHASFLRRSRWRFRMLAAVRSATLLGVEGRPVTVEVHVSTGLPGFQIVGLPDEACRESRDRVRAAVMSSGLSWPSKRITVNLAPSGLRKTGAGLDLPIALGVLAAADEVPLESLNGLGVIGELGLDGRVRAVPGVLCMTPAVEADVIVVPRASYAEASCVADKHVRSVSYLRELVDALRGDAPWPEQPEVPSGDADDNEFV